MKIKSGIADVFVKAYFSLHGMYSRIKRKCRKKMELKVMTFNLRCDCGEDGKNNWEYRTDLVKEAIYGENPDLIGFQEVTRNMFEDVRGMIDRDYVILGAGRNTDYTGEGVNIAFRKDKFDLLSMDTFWLSDTPSVPGSRYEKLDQSGCPRIAVITGLAVRGSGRVLYFCNTHLDHIGNKARVHGAKLILEKLSKLGTAKDTVLITGDMNALPDSEVISEFCNKELGIIEITDNIIEGTFHKWGEKTDKKIKIDYIFTNAERGEKPSELVTKYQKDGVYCSDHFPVCGYIKL